MRHLDTLPDAELAPWAVDADLLAPTEAVETPQAEGGDASESLAHSAAPEPVPETDPPPAGIVELGPDEAPGQPIEIDPAQILRDRPDVYAAYYRDYFGPNNDHNSPAWVQRVGGTTPEAYALYWFNTHGSFEGYTPRAPVPAGAGAQAEDLPYMGRTTIDGIPLSVILADRPDVFRAFFIEYYGPNNDRHSPAWNDRVGGATPEDYANFWYNVHGKPNGYVPANWPPRAAAAEPEPTEELQVQPPAPEPLDALPPDTEGATEPDALEVEDVTLPASEAPAESADVAPALPDAAEDAESPAEELGLAVQGVAPYADFAMDEESRSDAPPPQDENLPWFHETLELPTPPTEGWFCL